MITTITDTEMISNCTTHTARREPDEWTVSWLPGTRLTRNQAISAMTLAEVAAAGDLSPEHDLWQHVQGWAAELDLTAEQAVRRLTAEVAQ